uniref:Uncharacterized protein n=1 Tax=Myoviridae sp. ctjhW4 TaxID=2825162 RepID=A0A8S5PT47_9CAUD|nr:MAG TPA: hypothetical protein [Myoviridae sp. ctjhW4]
MTLKSVTNFCRFVSIYSSCCKFYYITFIIL